MIKKVLIVGSGGFIGTHLFSHFENLENFEAYGCDLHPKTAPLARYFSVNNPIPDYSSIFRSQNFDYCINASGSGNVAYSFIQSLQDFNLNVSNVIALLDAIKQNAPKCKFLNFSSAAVYGNPERIPTDETSEIKSLSPYGVHKFISETICKEYYNFFQIRTCSMRVFSAFGPGLKKQLFWDIYSKASQSKNNEVELWGTGDETRDFIFIDDIVQAADLIIQNDFFSGTSLNVANGIETTVRHAAACLLKNTYPGRILKFNGKQKEGDPQRWQADISILKSFGYSPRFGVEQGLVHYADWIKRFHNLNS